MSAAHITERHMNSMSVIVFVLCLLLVTSNTVFAYPYLQLDADPATYVYGSVHGEVDSIVTDGPEFTLYALVDSTQGSIAGSFYISGALVPSQSETDPLPDLGSIFFCWRRN